MVDLTLGERPKILVVALRRIGDVLLTTALIHSLKQRWPAGRIDALVFAETAGILDGNPDIAHIVSMPARASAFQSLSLIAQLWRRYDLAISTQPGDRPFLFARLAGRRAVAPVEDRASGRWKRRLLTHALPFHPERHRVTELLSLASAVGAAPVLKVVAPRDDASAAFVEQPYAVIHPTPMYRYKQWHAEGWRALATMLHELGMKVVVTGGPSADERRSLDAIWPASAPHIQRYDGKLSWTGLSQMLRSAAVYVGPDTSTTHLAAACGCPTVALYGPTDPRLWGPLPADGMEPDWQAAEVVQHRANVWIVQNPLPCLPCQREGCERNVDSYSWCLDHMPAEPVFGAVKHALAAKVSSC